MRVETVRGAMAVDGLGTTLMHEHVFVLTRGAILDGPELMTEMFVNDIRYGIGGAEVRAAFLKGVVEERGLTAMLVHNPARYFTGGQE